MTEDEIVEQFGEDFANVLAMNYKPTFDPTMRLYYWQEWQIEQVERDLSLLGVYKRDD
jgi:hypothetical protein